jgi:hypothetical protein
VQCGHITKTMPPDLVPSPFAVYPGGLSARPDAPAPGRQYQELWFSMARLHWASVVLVPVEQGGSAADVAMALAQVGTQLRDTPVTAIVANRMDYAAARALADLQPRLLEARAWPGAIEVAARPVAAGEGGGSTREPTVRSSHDATLLPPIGRAIIAIQPVVDEPLGVAVAQAADAVVLCIEMGKTHMAAARRTIELIGADRVSGAVLVR